jgi:quercetin dioxygenase-like cupin family protein
MTNDGPMVLLRSEETHGELAAVELGGRGRPPLHRHDFDETFYVLEGELTFQLDGEVVTRRAGELAFAPRGIPHTYANLSGAPARVLLIVTPAGFERYFARLAAERQGVEPPEWARGPIPNVTTLGPPLDQKASRRAQREAPGADDTLRPMTSAPRGGQDDEGTSGERSAP